MPKDGLEGSQTSLQGSHVSAQKMSAVPSEIIDNFISENGPEILANLAVVCIETGTKPSDIIVLVDIEHSKNESTTPALKNPPEFRTVPFHELFREHEILKLGTCSFNKCIQKLKMFQSN